jgi:7-carboxy-7-deazaguanine synthase
MTDQLISISELFGPTHQGEGPSAGKLTLFVRMGLCNLDCAWCDTPFTWDWTGKNGTAYDRATELRRMPVTDVVDWVLDHNVGRVVVSGGEPTVQMTALAHLLTSLDASGVVCEVETNGTRFPTGLPDTLLRAVQWNVSPKLASSGVPRDRALVFDVLARYAELPNANLKLVIATEEDRWLVDALLEVVPWDRDRVWLMPEGRTADEVNTHLAEVMPFAVQHRVNVTSRLQVLAYGDRRGV